MESDEKTEEEGCVVLFGWRYRKRKGGEGVNLVWYTKNALWLFRMNVYFPRLVRVSWEVRERFGWNCI
jgi:hypothetical protein